LLSVFFALAYFHFMDMIPHLVGYLALAITLVSFSLANDRSLQKLNLTGCVLWAVHFGMLGEWSACLMLIIAGVMVSASISGLPKLTNIAWLLNIILIPIMASMILGGGASWFEIFPVIGGFFINTGVAKCKGYGMTATIAIGHLIWIVAAIGMGSVPATVANALNLLALAYREFSRRKSISPTNTADCEPQLDREDKVRA
jgi:hypothetical protein